MRISGEDVHLAPLRSHLAVVRGEEVLFCTKEIIIFQSKITLFPMEQMKPPITMKYCMCAHGDDVPSDRHEEQKADSRRERAEHLLQGERVTN